MTLEIQRNQVQQSDKERVLGTGMQKAVSGLRLVHVSRKVQTTELREATTGRPVAVPRIWAVAEPVRPLVAESQPAPTPPKVELAFYRKYTEAMLRRYLRLSMEVGRVPSLMGRELFRGNVSHCRMEGFEDAVIFCIDIERCLGKLRKSEQRLIQRIAVQGYSQEDAAPMVGLCVRTCVVRYRQALDHLTELFLAGRLLEPLKSCQEVEAVENEISSS